MRSLRVVPMLLVLLVVAAAPAAAGTVHSYAEDFTTKAYCDTSATTALWDTSAGELKLPLIEVALAGEYDTPGEALALAIAGDYAYVADYSVGLTVVDVSDPQTPVLAGIAFLPGLSAGVALSGDFAFVADLTIGLRTVDISDPHNPSSVGGCALSGQPEGVAVSGNFAYVAMGSAGLAAVHTLNPMAPSWVGAYNTAGYAYAVAVAGNHAYVADGVNGLVVLDITSAGGPVWAGGYVPGATVYDVAVDGDYAYLAADVAQLLVVDIEDPTTPSPVGWFGAAGSARGVTVSGDRAYLAMYDQGILVVDVSDPTDPVLIDQLDSSGLAYGVAVDGEHAFLADGAPGVKSFDVCDPTWPDVVAAYDTPDEAWGVAVSGNYAYVADGRSVQVIDISDPMAPSFAGSATVPGTAYDIAVSGDYAYLGDLDGGLYAIDVSDPTGPALVGAPAPVPEVDCVAIAGDVAYVACRGNELYAVDISNPTTPTVLDACPANGRGVAVSGDYAFTVGGGFSVIRVLNPAAMTVFGSCSVIEDAYDIAVAGDYAYVSSGYGLEVYDVETPSAPARVGSLSISCAGEGIALSGNYAFVAHQSPGVQVVDITDPTSPVAVGYCQPGTMCADVAVSGQYVYAADWQGGLAVIRAFRDDFLPDGDRGQSLEIDQLDAYIVRARITAAQTELVEWELAANEYHDWSGVVPGGWAKLYYSGNDLRWRSTHTEVVPGVNPTVTDLRIEWLYEFAVIDSITDVPDDQGGWVRVHFSRSGLDFADETFYPIAAYDVHRRVDEVALRKRVLRERPVAPRAGGPPTVRLDGRSFLVGGDRGDMPPGVWEAVATVHARQEDEYIALAPTLADSMDPLTHSVYTITAHTTTPAVWYACPPDSGYSIDNIAPGVPSGFVVGYHVGGGNQLSWDPCPDEDFQYFRVYRSDLPDFTPGPENLVHSTAETEWFDAAGTGWHYYKLTALDHVGNESDPASPEETTGVEGQMIPKTFALYQNAPNPFGPGTTIRYDVPVGAGRVTIEVFDVRGRRVREILDAVVPSGKHVARWDGRDEGGQGVAAGVYYCRLSATDGERTIKMTLLR